MQQTSIRTILHLSKKAARPQTCKFSSGKLKGKDKEYDTSKAFAVLSSEMSMDEVYRSFADIPSVVLQGHSVVILATETEGGKKDPLMFGLDIRQQDRSGVFPRIIKDIFELLKSPQRQLTSYVEMSALSAKDQKLRGLMLPEGYNSPFETKSMISFVEALHILQYIIATIPPDESLIVKLTVTTEHQGYKSVGSITLYNAAPGSDEAFVMTSLLHFLSSKDYKSLSSMVEEYAYADQMLRSLTVMSIPYFFLSFSLTSKEDLDDYLVLLGNLNKIVTRPFPEASYNSFNLAGAIGWIRQVADDITSRARKHETRGDGDGEADGQTTPEEEQQLVRFLFENRGIRLANEVVLLLKEIEEHEDEFGDNVDVPMMIMLIHRLIADSTVVGMRKDCLKRRGVTQLVDVARNTGLSRAEYAEVEEKLVAEHKAIEGLEKALELLETRTGNLVGDGTNSALDFTPERLEQNESISATMGREGQASLSSILSPQSRSPAQDPTTRKQDKTGARSLIKDFSPSNSVRGAAGASGFPSRHTGMSPLMSSSPVTRGEGVGNSLLYDAGLLSNIDERADDQSDNISISRDLDLGLSYDLEVDVDDGDTQRTGNLPGDEDDSNVIHNSLQNMTPNVNDGVETTAAQSIQNLTSSSLLLQKLKNIQKSIHVLKQRLRNRKMWMEQIGNSPPVDMLLSATTGIPCGYGSDLSREQREEAIKGQKEAQQMLDQAISREIQKIRETTETILRDIDNEDDFSKVINELLNERSEMIDDLKREKKRIKREINELRNGKISELNKRFINIKAEIASVENGKKQNDSTIEILNKALDGECKVIKKNYDTFKQLTDFIQNKIAELKRSLRSDTSMVELKLINKGNGMRQVLQSRQEEGMMNLKSLSAMISPASPTSSEKSTQEKLAQIRENIEKSIEDHRQKILTKENELNQAKVSLERTRTKSLAVREDFKATVQEIVELYDALKSVYSEHSRVNEEQRINKELVLIKLNKDKDSKNLKEMKAESKEKARLELIRDRLNLLEEYQHIIEEQVDFMGGIYGTVYHHTAEKRKEVMAIKSQVEQEDNANAMQMSELETKVALAKAIDVVGLSKERIAEEIEETKREADEELLSKTKKLKDPDTLTKQQGSRVFTKSSVSMEIVGSMLLNSPKERPPWRRVKSEERPNPRTSKSMFVPFESQE